MIEKIKLKSLNFMLLQFILEQLETLQKLNVY